MTATARVVRQTLFSKIALCRLKEIPIQYVSIPAGHYFDRSGCPQHVT